MPAGRWTSSANAWRSSVTLLALGLAIVVSARPAQDKPAAEAPVGTDFVNDVLPVITKIGCNAGGCHGAALGQNEFKLSLLGYDPRSDWEAITRELKGRRVNSADAGQSLVLLKPSGALDHGGGRVLPKDSEGYRIVLRWLEDGAPFRTTKRDLVRIEVASSLRVTAHYSDGASRDVTRWALYSSNDDAVADVDAGGRVTLRAPGETAILVRYGGFVALNTVSRPFREVKLDYEIRNLVDTHVADRIRSLGTSSGTPCDDATFVRRAHLDLIGTLPTADEVRAFLKNPDRDALVDRLIARPEFAAYWAYRLAQLFRPSKPFCDWLRKQIENDAPWDGIARDILRSKGREPAATFYLADNPSLLAENFAQTFLGTRIQCAQCHNHPFERFSRDDYYALSSFFARVRVQDGSVVLVDRGDIRHPRTRGVVEPALPGGRSVTLGADRRDALADWATKENPQFARAMVNRVWALLLGRGLVEPVDDMRTSNPPSNPALLDALARDFAENRHSLRRLVRIIATSNSYRRLREPRLLSAEVLLDAIAQATGVPDAVRAISDPTLQSYSLDVSGRRRAFEGSLAQALHFIAGDTINAKLAKMPEMTLEEMYLRALSRFPADKERRELRTREEREDLMWALLNSKEFVYGH